MDRERRLRRSADFAAVYQHGRSWSQPLLAVRARSNDLPDSHVGFSVGRRVGSAVVRNRVRRRLREIARQVRLRSGFDVVVIARPAAAEARFDELADAVRSLMRRARLLAERAAEGREA
ncbi:MAG: ribonuclease P protein component [Chloroflexi bacterium]|nr:ribonuclease P protein component [Chloroflexota bacterium]